MTLLYAKDSKGNMRSWQVVPTITGFDMISGLDTGKKTCKSVPVTPKANRTMVEQTRLEMYSRVKRKMDAGFVHYRDEAETSRSMSYR